MNRLVFILLMSVQVFCFAGGESILRNRIPESNKRYSGFCLAFKMMEQRGVKIIVETGTARCGDKNCEGDGCSTVLFGHWACKNKAMVYSVDHGQHDLNVAKQSTKRFASNIRYICSDSIGFLRQFPLQIDFLYLDSVDFDENEPELSQRHHLEEIIGAYPHLTLKTVVMIDDCDLAK